MSHEVVCEIVERRAVLKLNRPERLNALNVALVASLEEQARRVGALSDVDVVLVDPQYTASLGDDPSYRRVVASVEAVARADAVPVVFRSKAVRYLTEQRANAGQGA